MFGRFVPDFGRVVAQMQFDMYHHYTVDEHSIRAIGLLAAIERGELKADHPLSTAIIKQIASRRVLYVAVLLHDIAKGRGGDHSEIGAEIALKLGPRFGLDPAETETVSWLVRYHLLMSSTAFKRDLADPKTIEDFVRQVQSPERLRLLLILTVVDIRAVGPGVWNDWKRTLLRTLFEAAEERLRLGHKQHGRTALVENRQQELAAALGWKAERVPRACAAPSRQLLAGRAARLAGREREAGRDRGSAYRRCAAERRCGGRSATAARPGSASSRPIARACSTGSALGWRRPERTSSMRASTRRATAWRSTTCWCSTRAAGPIPTARLRSRLVRSVETALTAQRAAAAPRCRARTRRAVAFRVAPSVAVADRASTRTTVVEVNALDRPALLAALAAAIHGLGHRSTPPISRPTASGRSTSSI